MRMRAAITQVPDGVYYGEDAVDDDGEIAWAHIGHRHPVGWVSEGKWCQTLAARAPVSACCLSTLRHGPAFRASALLWQFLNGAVNLRISRPVFPWPPGAAPGPA